MNAETLLKGLRTLQDLGWPVSPYQHETGTGAAIIYPDGGHDSCDYLLEGGFEFQRDEAKLKGWLVASLEVRGLRREVYWFDGKNCFVNLTDATERDVASSEYREGPVTLVSELEALIQACLSLSEQPTPQGETTAAGGRA